MPPKKKDEKKDLEEEAKPVEDTGVFVFSDKSRYSGQFVRRDGVIKRNGRGTFHDGFLRYDGEWKDDTMHGAGSMKFASGASYDGSIHENSFDGKGRYVWPDGSWYEGQWRNNRMHGDGVYCDADSRQWEGRFYNGTGPGLKRQAIPQAIGAVAARVHELAASQAAGGKATSATPTL
jgi:hypothetical protein